MFLFRNLTRGSVLERLLNWPVFYIILINYSQIKNSQIIDRQGIVIWFENYTPSFGTRIMIV